MNKRRFKIVVNKARRRVARTRSSCVEAIANSSAEVQNTPEDVSFGELISWLLPRASSSDHPKARGRDEEDARRQGEEEERRCKFANTYALFRLGARRIRPGGAWGAPATYFLAGDRDYFCGRCLFDSDRGHVSKELFFLPSHSFDFNWRICDGHSTLKRNSPDEYSQIDSNERSFRTMESTGRLRVPAKFQCGALNISFNSAPPVTRDILNQFVNSSTVWVTVTDLKILSAA
ncbi:hypothetical protein C8R47DRAFT_1075234 [Mycena vitilis]|nr:hypothetical protein C8R47DRAFT_1075234 [Mycena vitilis]